MKYFDFKCQNGFTFIELIIASLLSSILIGSLLVLLIQAKRLTEFAINAVNFNREAREVFSLIGNGFKKDVNSYVSGLNGCFLNDQEKFITWGGGSKEEIIIERITTNNVIEVNDINISTLSNIEYEKQTLGFVYRSEIKKDSKDNNVTQNIVLQLMDPDWMRDNDKDQLFKLDSRNTDMFRAQPSRIRESYHTAFYLPVDRNIQ